MICEDLITIVRGMKITHKSHHHHISPKPSSSCTLILCTCRLVGINSIFLSAFRLLALKDGPDVLSSEQTMDYSCSVTDDSLNTLWIHQHLKPMQTQTPVVVEVRQCFLVSLYYRLVLGDNLTPQTLPAGG